MAAHQIHHATWGADYNFYAALQLTDLSCNRITAIDCEDTYAFGVFANFSEFPFCLHGKFAGWAEDERLGAAGRFGAHHGWNAKRDGFTGAGMAFADDVRSCKNGGNCARLNFGRCGKSHIIQCAQNGFGQVQFRKTGNIQRKPPSV